MTKRTTRTRKKKAVASQRQLNPNAAGIDLGATVHYVAVPPERDPQPVRHFGTLTEDLEALADWLKACAVTTVAMEANRLAAALRMAAQSFHRSKFALGDWFRRIRAKLGTKAAVTAAAHKLARILYAMVKHRSPFEPARLGNPEQSRARKERYLRRQAEGLGFTLTPVEQEVS